MKDIDIRTIQPVHGHRTPDKAGKADKAAGQDFGKVFDSTLARDGELPKEPPTVKQVEQKLDQQGLQINDARNSLQRLIVDMQLLGKTGKPRTDEDGRG
jgi:hypothetical protein